MPPEFILNHLIVRVVCYVSNIARTKATVKSSVSWDNTSCSQPSANQVLLASSFMLASCFAYSSTQKMEATCSSETSLDYQRNTRNYILEDITFYNHQKNPTDSN
jgi:hypothetical protein